MEPSPEKFDPEQHRMLDDGQSWVRKEVSPFLREPQDISEQYNNFVDEVVAANPGITPQRAHDKIMETENKYGCQIIGMNYDYFEQSTKLVYFRRTQSALNELNVLPEKDKPELEKILADFNQAAQAVSQATGEKFESVFEHVDTLMLKSIAKNLNEAKEIIINGPIVEGFNETADPKIPNHVISQFLKDTFKIEELRKSGVCRISKDDYYALYLGVGGERIQQFNQLVDQKLLICLPTGQYMAKDANSYVQVEMILENVDDPKKISHTFKYRASTAGEDGFNAIHFHSFGVEKPDDYAYLNDLDLSSDGDKIRAFILGTVAHEVAHRYEKKLDKNFRDQFKIAGEEDYRNGSHKYVTDYVQKHESTFHSPDWMIQGEDFAETIRLYTTNSNYLKQHFPSRHAFIQTYLPNIRPDTIVETIKNIPR